MITAIRNFLQRRRGARRGPWCTCFEDRDLDAPLASETRYVHCLLDPVNARKRPASPVRCQGNGCWTP